MSSYSSSKKRKKSPIDIDSLINPENWPQTEKITILIKLLT